MNYVIYPNLPSPEFINEHAIESMHQQRDRYCQRQNDAVANAVCTRHQLSAEAVTWINQYIASDYSNLGFNCHGPGTAIPHTDRTRNWTLMWLVDTGGDDVETVFWQEQGHPVVREPDCYPASYDNLIELYRTVIAPGQWVLLNSHVLHSIENMTSVRKSLQVGFWQNDKRVRSIATHMFSAPHDQVSPAELR